MKKSFYFALSLLVLMALTALAPAFAHEGREADEFRIVFGWQNEPAYAGMMNGPEIFISFAENGHDHDHDDHSDAAVARTVSFERGHGHDDHDHDDHGHNGMSIADVPVSLQAEVTFGDQTTTVSFRRAWGTDDQYIAELIPTLPGDYTFRVFGTIGDVEIDEIFSSADGQFSTVEPASDIMFPALPSADARIADLEARIEALEAIIAELQGNS